MKLYKFISFEKEHWSDPFFERKLFFSSVTKLLEVNDRSEFSHRWDSESFIINNFMGDFSQSYNSLFQNAKTLCFSKSLNPYCWKEFANDNGICYEFTFNKPEQFDISIGHVTYDNNKSFNVPKYLYSKIRKKNIRKLLRRKYKVSCPSTPDTKLLGV